MGQSSRENERRAALDQIEVLMKQHAITTEDISISDSSVKTISRPTHIPSEMSQQEKGERLSASESLYNIGALIMLSGTWALVGVSWGSLESFGKIFISLSIVILTYLLAIGVGKVRALEKVSPALYLATIATVPVAAIALLDAVSPDLSGSYYLLSVALISGAVSVIGWIFHRIAVFVLGQLVYVSLAYIAIVQIILETLPSRATYYDEFAVTLFVLLGITYCVLGFVATKYTSLLTLFKNGLYGFGALVIYGSLFTQTGWSSEQVTIMGILYPVLVFIGIIASAVFKQPSILVVATIALAVFIIKTTFLYFSDNLGWSFALILSGLLTIAIGVGANVLAKRLGMSKKD